MFSNDLFSRIHKHSEISELVNTYFGSAKKSSKNAVVSLICWTFNVDNLYRYKIKENIEKRFSVFSFIIQLEWMN